ncbi:hypothetical protein Aduo_010714 [Ancylostoma duodenale]
MPDKPSAYGGIFCKLPHAALNFWNVLKKYLQLTFDVTMTAEDTRSEKSSRDYSAATPPYRRSVSRSYKRATKSTTPSSRKADPPMAKTQKSHTPSPRTPLGF